ncbi:MAG: OstA-like protein [Cyclonatronaceae bacterium]
MIPLIKCSLWPFLIFLLIGIPQRGVSQSRVQIIQAEQLQGFSGEFGPGRKLTGNVQLRIEDSFIEADSVFQFLDLNEIRAFGNIQVTTPRETIWSDRAVYNYLIDDSNFENRVIIVTENVTIFSSQAYYSFGSEIAEFPAKLRLEDKRGTLLADNGIYYTRQDSAVFRGNVQFADSTQYVEADSMFSNRVNEYYELHSRVFMLDSENRTRLSGDYAERDSLGRRLIKGDARLIRLNEEATDSTHMSADLIEVTELDTTFVTQASGNVSIWSPEYATLSDSSSYLDSTEEFFLIGDGNIWYRDIQLTGQHILILFRDEALDRIDATLEPFAVFQDTLTGRLNQLRGDSIAVLFNNGDLSLINGRPDARIFYHMKNQNDEPDGGIELTARSAFMYFDEGEMVDFKAFVNIDGTVHPESSDVLGKKIEGFIWTPEKKPLKPTEPLKQRLDTIPDLRPFEFPAKYLLYTEQP